ncbi:asparagine synthase (glutamine-hydrolyzing) [Pollutibacter soli]|uniref:asparagine synthase (glutamine-hydrolyzing) n=1 Tax=Pollutibacter soli TaxID=3034157 RepID=UPI0030133DC9
MSGIAGFISMPDKSTLANLSNQIQKHRGPDKQSIWEDNYISISQQYLHLSSGPIPQDIIYSRYEYVIVFDGELYNIPELVKLLEGQQVHLNSQNSSEIILEMYILFGEDMHKYLNGMFAVGIYNSTTNDLFLTRDHVGIKPLFYTKVHNGFAFSSELKTLLSIPGFDKTIDPKALVSCLNYIWISGNESMFRNAKKLQPAHSLNYRKDQKIEIKRYWDINDKEMNQIFDEPKLANRLAAEFEASVLRHLYDDVKVCCFLSGGLDSSLVSSITHKKQKQLSTYTISISEEDKKVEQMPDDEKYAAYLAKHMGFDHNVIQIKPDIVKSLPEIVKILDEPVGDPAAINTYLICKAVKEKGINVMLAGMGSDEIFLGHRGGKATLWTQQYFNKLPGFAQKTIISVGNQMPVMIGRRGFRFGRWVKRFLSFVSLPIDQAYMRSYSYYSPNQLKDLVTLDYKGAVDTLVAEHKSIFESKFSDDPINQICYTDINMFLVGLNLTYTDRASMGASVRVRMPFVDKIFIEEVMRLQGRYKLRGRVGKYIMKKAARKFVPEKIINRPKAAFGAPIRSWISNDLKGMVDDLLSEENIKRRGFLNYPVVKKIIDNDRKGIEDNAYQIYQFLTLEIWCREFLDK